MSEPHWMQRMTKIEQVGVLRALMFLKDGERLSNEFEQVMSYNTFVKAKPILHELGWTTERKGEKRRIFHSLTDKGEIACQFLQSLLKV